VVDEVCKAVHNAGARATLSFYRTRDGAEVDLVVETGRGCVAIEVKSGATVAADFFDGLAAMRADLGADMAEGWLVYGGERREVRPAARVLPWSGISELGAIVAG
jgi:hypothetical protein